MSRSFRAKITPGNVELKPGTKTLKNSHLPTGELRRHLEPLGVMGGSSKKQGLGKEVAILVDGEAFRTDIASDKPTIFRNRSMARRFIERHGPAAGDEIVYEEVGPLVFNVSMARDWRPSAIILLPPAAEEQNGEDLSADGEGMAVVPPAENSDDDGNERIKTWALRETRPGQAAFRKGVAERDGLCCAVTGCCVADVLEAAHLDRRGEGGSDDPANGIILRADIHRLFDGGLMIIDPATRKVAIPGNVADASYRALDGATLQTKADLRNLEKRNSAGTAA